MKYINIKKYFTAITILIMAIALTTFVISFLLVLGEYKISSKQPDYKKGKVIVNEALNYLEDNFQRLQQDKIISNLDTILKENNLQVKVLNLNGKTLYNSLNNSESNEIVNLKYINAETKYGINYISPIVVEDKVIGNTIFYIPKEEILDNKKNKVYYFFIPLSLGLVAVMILLIRMNVFMKRYILNPIEDLNNFTDNLSKGKYKNKLKYEIDSEVTRLCSGFELMQDELQYTLELQNKLEKERKELIVCISHDMRTPLASIKAYIGAIKDGFAKDAETLNNYIQIIDSKSDNILKLINDFFEHSKADLGELKVNKSSHYSGKFILENLENYKMEFENKGVKLTIDTDLPEVLVDIDTLRMEQVIFNLLQNSLKYTSSGGSVHFGAFTEGKFLRFYIKDTGVGISNFDLPYIFDKFYRGEKEQIEEFQDGTGLGLYLCKYIIEAHGGEIYAESKLGEGTTISFTIPKI